MRNLDLNNYGLQEMNTKEMKNVDGGMNDRPFGTSYDGYPSGGSGGSGGNTYYVEPGGFWFEVFSAWFN